MWLASVSARHGDGTIIATSEWPERRRQRAEAILEEMLEGVGDTSREVLFRMNITLCRHRGLSAEEEARLPGYFKDARPTDTAGCSVETIWRKGVTSPASLPCENPGRRPTSAERPDLWLPEPCGKCEPCLDRERVRIERTR